MLITLLIVLNFAGWGAVTYMLGYRKGSSDAFTSVNKEIARQQEAQQEMYENIRSSRTDTGFDN